MSAIVLVAWFPTSDLLHQHQALASAAAHLDHVRQEDQALAREQHRLQSPTEISRLARQQYALVSPGQQAYQVLPTGGLQGGAPAAGDPGLAPLAAPTGDVVSPRGSQGAASPTAATATSVTTAGTSSRGAGSSASEGFAGRILNTLEFWR